MNLFEKIGEFTPDSLIVSNEFPILKEGCGLKQGQKVLKRGSLIVKDGSGDFVIAPQESKGVTAFGILADDVDTGDTGEDKVPAVCYVTGIFNPEAVIVGESATVTDYADAMRGRSIFLRAVQNYDPAPGK